MHPFEFHKAATLEDAGRLLRSREDARLLAGGMTLLPILKMRLSSVSDLIDLTGIKGLAGIREEGRQVVIGAMATHAAVSASSLVRARIPAIARLAGAIGDAQVRNLGTLGGSIAFNDPAADYPAALVALNATVRTTGRRIPAEAFFRGPFETVLEPDEIITAVEFPVPRRAAYEKFPNPAARLAIVGVMVAADAQSVRVTVVGAGGSVFRVPAMEQALTADFSVAALSGVEISPDGLNHDIHASAAYRVHLIRVLARRAVEACA